VVTPLDVSENGACSAMKERCKPWLDQKKRTTWTAIATLVQRSSNPSIILSLIALLLFLLFWTFYAKAVRYK
jgi:uncharacterized membrane protein YdfJ with MMPL/SSD domain